MLNPSLLREWSSLPVFIYIIVSNMLLLWRHVQETNHIILIVVLITNGKEQRKKKRNVKLTWTLNVYQACNIMRAGRGDTDENQWFVWCLVVKALELCPMHCSRMGGFMVGWVATFSRVNQNIHQTGHKWCMEGKHFIRVHVWLCLCVKELIRCFFLYSHCIATSPYCNRTL